MSSPLSDKLHQILDRFDDAWNGTPPPCIEDYLAEADPAQRLPLLIELVRIDLERRLAAGGRVRLEENYPRNRFPELYAETSALVTLVKQEFAIRSSKEPNLMPAEYLERFPKCQTELIAQLPTVEERLRGERLREMPEVTQLASAPTELDLRGYPLIETLGKGGMGEVYRCSDPALGRDLAIKVMKADLRGHPDIESRFFREARITGSLQHPGIVPIHNLGRLSDGRLHYTMRLVRGRTFADILKEEAGKPERLPSLLSIFEKICQAVAYAHSKRVIHRDLKPSNVMVGRFGEVQVMDWGLAKVLAADLSSTDSEEVMDAAGTRIPTEVDTPVDLSRTGSGFGTLPYMPSEQARGKWDVVDERADVFALGSILCEILTGQPAYSGTNDKDLSDRVERGDVVEALQRLERCGADAALTALCRECLSPRRGDRPNDAAVLAKRLADYQVEVQERLRQAEIQRAEAQLKGREGRKQRRLLIALVFVLLAGGSFSTWQAVRATVAEEKARENERRAISERENKEAVLAFFQDNVLSAGRPKEQEGGLGLGVTLRQAVDKGEKSIADSFKDRPLVEASIRDTLGSTYLYAGEATLAIEQYERALELREALLQGEPKNAQYQADLALIRRSLELARLLGRARQFVALKHNKEAETALTKIEELKPDSPETWKECGRLRFDLGQISAATADFRKALELLGEKAKPAESAASGADRLFSQLADDALLERLTAVVESRPEDMKPRWQRGQWYAGHRRWKEAAADFTIALKRNPSDDVSWWLNAAPALAVGDSESYRWQRREMLNRFGETQDPVTAERIAKACLLLPESAKEMEWACALAELAVTRGKNHILETYFVFCKGLADYRRGNYRAAAQGLYSLVPRVAFHPPMDASCHLVLAMALHRQGEAKAAREHLTKAVKLLDKYIYDPARFPMAGSQYSGDWLIAWLLNREAQLLIEGIKAEPKK